MSALASSLQRATSIPKSTGKPLQFPSFFIYATVRAHLLEAGFVVQGRVITQREEHGLQSNVLILDPGHNPNLLPNGYHRLLYHAFPVRAQPRELRHFLAVPNKDSENV